MEYTLFSIPFLLAVIYQDFKSRTISVFLPIIIFLLFFGVGFYQIRESIFSNLLINFLFLLLQWILLKFYFYFRYRQFVIADRFIGRGDFIFFIALTPAFSVINFLFLFVGALVFSLINGLIYILKTKQLKSTEIPLAGLFAMYFLVIFLVNSFLNSPFHPLNDDRLIHFLNLWKTM